MPGKKTGDDLFNAYAAMDLFVFSSFSETQGLVVAEAMAAGLSVVALDASGVREVVENDKNGFLLPADTPADQFAKAIAAIHDKEDLRRTLQEGARKAVQKFSRRSCSEKALAFYDFVRAETREQRQIERNDAWAALLKRIEVEWGLIAEKSKAALTALLAEDEVSEQA
jgi:glycosyltransferase involved in cell wall biosynthesis